ncbi:exo-alpha-sialidase [Microlunatus elymi]|uniref:Exo-alpha-sialidase n=1 Tax=Microlunatus elymi TaxID=2596828 RepID=A0A516PUV4_9ACTN|nr:sialidase family protein [Microlunatus elymi]QDP94731.1 exo-alpha-sialidase [Microlunatus elymi]
MSRHPIRFLLSLCVAVALALAGLTPASAVPTGGALNGTRLMAGTALYPRVLRLQHSGSADGRIIASVVTFGDSGGIGAIFASRDDGRSFSRIGSVVDPGAAQGLCCSTLYELPRRVGDLTPGTLLWSASVGQNAGADRRMTVPIWASRDHGRSWQRLATVLTAANSGGLWEPEFAVSRDGRLVLYVSDETQQPAHSQTLIETVSRDGRSWSAARNVVAAADPDLRPGMPVVRRLPNGSYLMSYEICGPGQDCRQRVRRAPDGVSWGDPADLGRLVATRDGQQFRHAPTISWYDDRSGGGALLSVGQMLYDRDGDVAAGNGSTIFYTSAAPEGRWRTAQAPVRIAAPYDNYCPNYSSSLLPMPERGRLLELATGYDDSGVCTTYFATGRLPG